MNSSLYCSAAEGTRLLCLYKNVFHSALEKSLIMLEAAAYTPRKNGKLMACSKVLPETLTMLEAMCTNRLE